MFNRIKRAYKAFVKPPGLLLVAQSEMTVEQAKALGNSTGKTVVLTHDINNYRLLEDAADLGDGNAEFLGEGSQDEYVEQQRTDEGTEPWYRRLARLGKTEHDTGGGNTEG